MKILIKEVKTNKDRKNFILYPCKLFKGNPNFVPALYFDEMKALKHKSQYDDVCDTIYFLAYDENNKICGRIAGIIQKQYNEKNKERRVRFDRFDSINNQDVANALFKAVEDWGKEKGMDTICGPLGFSDMEREGLLIEGFDQPCTFEEQYHADYYKDLISNLGYEKEVDWVEYKLYPPKEVDPRLERAAELGLKMNKLHVLPLQKNTSKYIKTVTEGFFDVIDECFKNLYGVVPFTESTKESMVTQFKLFVKPKYVNCLMDENNKMVATAFRIPSLTEAFRGTSGRLTPITLFKLFHAVNHPKVIDLALIGVLPRYQGKGVNTWFISEVIKSMKKEGIEYMNTNLNLENNDAVQAQWKYFDCVRNKRRRAFVKTLKK